MSNDIFGFFGLRENPFKINPDPRFMFLTPQLQSVSDELAYAVETRKGLILLTGEVGTGKTMLVRRLLNWLAERKMPTALIFNARLNPDNLLDLILNDFGIPCASAIKSEKLICLNTWLLDQYRAGQIPVLIVDEAQGLPPHVLEEVRLLLNFETPRDKLLQIILAGQPELTETLKRHELRQLRQRITIRCKTSPLTLEQTHGYIHERLRIAGASTQIFDPQCIGFIYTYAHGIPRVINVLCDHALINSCADGARLVSPHHVEQAARDCQFEKVDSVTRILNSGSHARTGLDQIGAILARVSATSSISPPPPATPLTSRLEAPSAAPPKQPLGAQSAFPDPSITPAAEIPSRPQAPLPDQPASNLKPRADVSVATPPVIDEAVASTPSGRNTPVSIPRWALFTIDYLRICCKSFASDAKKSARQLRKSLESARLRHWLPVRRQLRLHYESLQVSLTRFVTDPRWSKLQNDFSRTINSAWRKTTARLDVWLQRPFDSARPASRNTASPSRSKSFATLVRAKRHSTVASLRRWLQQPMDNRPRTTGTSDTGHRAGHNQSSQL